MMSYFIATIVETPSVFSGFSIFFTLTISLLPALQAERIALRSRIETKTAYLRELEDQVREILFILKFSITL